METKQYTKQDKLIAMLHHNMAIFGGFMAVYAILNRCDFMGNAQTSNLIYLVLAILGTDFRAVLIRLVAVLIYMLGAICYVLVKNKTKLSVQYVGVLVDAVSVFLLALIPEEANPIVALYPIFFAMSFQWNAFPGSYGYVSSTIFSTNNTRQVSLALGEYLCDHKKKHLHKAGFFLGSLAGFHIGVAAGYFATKFFGLEGIWFDLIFLVPAAILIYCANAEEENGDLTVLS